jgi:hypothetical protein
VQTFAATDGMATAVSTGVEVNIGAAVICGTGEEVSVGIKVKGVGSGRVGVGSVENEKLHPVKRKHPINRIDMSLLFMAVPLHNY